MSHEEYCAQFIPRNGKILDVGSGRGKFLAEMAKLGFNAFGIETNTEYIKDLNSAIQGRAEELPFPEKYFDFVNCAEVSEHADDPIKILKEIFRVLKPGGKCYISFHNRWGIYDYHYHMYFINWMPRGWTEPILKFFGREKENGQAGRQKLISMHYYTYGQISKLMRSVGFFVLDIREEKMKALLHAFYLPFLVLYFIFLRPLYFNTFHFLLAKP